MGPNISDDAVFEPWKMLREVTVPTACGTGPLILDGCSPPWRTIRSMMRHYKDFAAHILSRDGLEWEISICRFEDQDMGAVTESVLTRKTLLIQTNWTNFSSMEPIIIFPLAPVYQRSFAGWTDEECEKFGVVRI